MQLKGLHWSFYRLDEQRDLHVQTTVAPGLNFHTDQQTTDLVVAAKYLEVGPEATSTRKVPDSLLGVAAQRHRFHKFLPLEALRSRVAEELPKFTKRLDILVKAQSVQGAIEEQHAIAWGDPLLALTVDNPHTRELPLPLEVSAAPEPENTYKYLYELTCTEDIGENFQDLQEIRKWLRGATPGLPRSYQIRGPMAVNARCSQLRLHTGYIRDG